MTTTACLAPSSSTPSDHSAISVALRRLRGDEDYRFEDLFPLVYRSLLRIAARLHRGRARHDSALAVELVHEAYLRLLRVPAQQWEGRRHFFAAAAKSMRRLLIDQARRAGRLRHGGGVVLEALDRDPVAEKAEGSCDLLALDEALERLRAQHQRAARVVELKYYARCSNEETAAAVGRCTRTVERDWLYAKAWLARELGEA